MLKGAALAPAILLSAAFSLLIGCSNSNSDLTTAVSETQNIVNGTEVTEMTDARSSTVFLINFRPNRTTSFCTGTLIDKNLVLTSAHCMPSQEGTQVRVAFGRNLTESLKGPLLLVTEIEHNPSYKLDTKSINNAPYDMAIFKFNGVMPEGFKARPLPTEDYKITESDTLEMIGYGQTSEIIQDAAVLRRTELPTDRITDIIHIQATDDDEKVTEMSIPLPGTILVKQPDTGVCIGDSGGPLYVRDSEGQLTYVGITSTGVDVNPTALNPTGNSCHGVSIFADVRTQLKWITETVAKLNK